MPHPLARRFIATPCPLPLAGTCWADTEPMAFLDEGERGSAPRPPSFRQALEGLHVDEVADDELFHRYFGAAEGGGRR